MKKEYLYIISLVIGVLAIVALFLRFSEIVDISDLTSTTAIYISIATACYAALAKPNPNKSKKQEIYGQLKKAIIEDISKLESKNYQGITLGAWDSIQVDERHQIVDDEKLKTRLDNLWEKIKQYNSAIDKLDNKILPQIIKDTAEEVFQKEPDNPHLTFSLHFYGEKKPKESTPELLYHLKRKHSLEDIVNYSMKKEGIKEEEVSEVGMKIHYLKAYEPLNLFRQELEKKNDYSQSTFTTNNLKFIANFWEKCLQKMDSVPEHKLMVEENEHLLKETKELLPELRKRIKKTIEA